MVVVNQNTCSMKANTEQHLDNEIKIIKLLHRCSLVVSVSFYMCRRFEWAASSQLKGPLVTYDIRRTSQIESSQIKCQSLPPSPSTPKSPKTQWCHWRPDHTENILFTVRIKVLSVAGIKRNRRRYGHTTNTACLRPCVSVCVFVCLYIDFVVGHYYLWLFDFDGFAIYVNKIVRW